MAAPILLVCLVVLNIMLPFTVAQHKQVGFYSKTCPNAEQLVRSVVQKSFLKDKSMPAGLLRLHFHDCFVRGCDASVLVDSTEDNIAEKDAVPNLTLRGFDLIDEIKALLENRCKGIVSCADILALATRDAVAMSGGLQYPVPTGRKDGLVSKIEDVIIPGPTFSIDAALSAFESVGLNLTDLATLLGAHTIGFAHCGFFNDQVYDFEDSGMADPSMDPTLVTSLKKVCPPPDQITSIRKDPKVFLDGTKGNPFSFDSGFYHEVLHNRAILQIDQELLSTDITSDLAATYAGDVFACEIQERAYAQKVEVKVPLYSYGCERKIRKALSHFKGLHSIDVDFYQQKVTVTGLIIPNEVLAAMKAKRKNTCFWSTEDGKPELHMNCGSKSEIMKDSKKVEGSSDNIKKVFACEIQVNIASTSNYFSQNDSFMILMIRGSRERTRKRWR